jgi:hypothetical protein
MGTRELYERVPVLGLDNAVVEMNSGYRAFHAVVLLYDNDPIQPAATDGRSMEKRVTAARLQ